MPQLARDAPSSQLLPVDIVAPGRLGLNTEQSAAVLGSEYCTVAQNAVIDVTGRLAARYGVGTYSSTGFTTATQTQTLFEYNAGGGTYQKICIGSTGTAQQISNQWGVIGANQLGAGTASLASTNRWYCQNFNNKLIAFQSGQSPVVYSAGTPLWNLVVASQGTVKVSNGVGSACFGRVWSCRSDGHTIDYSGLLDETDWGSASSGTLDMSTIWVNGTDTVTAIFPFNAALVICGYKHIVMFTDGRGSSLGIDPTQMYVFDILTGTGCLSQWTVDAIGESDIAFLSPNGVQSLQRLLADRNNPTQNFTKFVRSVFLADIADETYSNITGMYNPLLGQYFITLPNSATVWVLDLKRKYADDVGNICAVVTLWNIKTYTIEVDHTYATYFGINGKVALYSGYADYTGTAFGFAYQSGHMNFQQQAGDQISSRVKMLKRIEATVASAGGTNINLTWITDFGRATASASVALSSAGANAEYGLAEYGLAEFGGGSALVQVKYPARGRGQYYQINISTSVSGAFALQQMQLATKIGRVA